MAIVSGTRSPDRMFMTIPGLSPYTARQAANQAALEARRAAPKLSGVSAGRITAIWGPGWFGIHWVHSRVWYQNAGIRPFVMRSLAGKVIPMWIDDPTGQEAIKNPKAKTRVTESGRSQILIFRRAATVGQRKIVQRRVGGTTMAVNVPMSYPGAPGRIAMREATAPNTQPGKIGGQIAKGNAGVRWYYPGLSPRNFLQYGLAKAAATLGVPPGTVQVGFDFYTREDIEQSG